MTPNSLYSDAVFASILRGLSIGNGCWEWKGYRNKLGYGSVHMKYPSGSWGRVGAYRVLWEMVYGKIPPDMECDHLCRNRSCVRPDHIEIVTHAENIKRSGPYKKWTHCAKGHELKPGNLKRANKGKFRCLICAKERERERQKRLVASGKCRCGKEREDLSYKSCNSCRTFALAYFYSKKPVPAKSITPEI